MAIKTPATMIDDEDVYREGLGLVQPLADTPARLDRRVDIFPRVK